MKAKTIFSAASIVLGFLLGWLLFLKDSGTPNSAEVHKTKLSSRVSSPSSESTSPEEQSVVESERNFAETREEENQQRRDLWERVKEKRAQARREKERIRSQGSLAFLVNELSLTEVQEAMLRSYFDQNIAEIETRGSEKTFEGERLDEILRGSLSPSQANVYADLKEKKRSTGVEAEALRKLTKLDFLDLRPEQRDSIYDDLYAQTDETLTSSEIELFPPSRGLTDNSDPEDLKIFLNYGATEDESDEAKATRLEIRQQEIDNRVDSLRPFLEKTQLERYRRHLESR